MSLTSSISLAGNPVVGNTTSGKQDRVKVAIEPDPANKQNVQPILRDFEHSVPLSSILKEVALRWGIEKPEMLSFKYANDSKGKIGYVTEDNRQELKNGDILCIAMSPSFQAKETYNKVNSSDPLLKIKGIEELLLLSRDYTFAVEFISINNGTGIQAVLVTIELTQLSPGADKTPPLPDKSNLSNVLGAFQELMEHGIVSWDTVGENFAKKIVNIIERSRDKEYFRPSIVHRCLGILESIVMNSTKYYNIVAQEVQPSNLLGYIRKDSAEVTHYTLVLINALLAKAKSQSDLLRQLAETNFSRVIHDNILQNAVGGVDRDIAHQLSIYQSFILNQVEGRMRTTFRNGDPEMENLLKQLPYRAFSDEYRSKGIVSEQHWKQLGFSQSNPRDDFRDTPPGLLALDCMEYLAKTKHEVYTRLLFAQMDNPCPFAKTSVALVKVLCSIFRIGEQPSDISYVTEFIPLLILNEEPFKEIYCATIQLLFKTWREMRAGILDLEKVTAVVTKQITMVMSQDASTLTSSETLRNRLFELSYKKITESEEHSQLLDDSVLKSRPVQDLKTKITPEIYELVKRERLNHLVQGSAFPKVGAKRRDQFFYCRLSPNHKIIHFGDAAGHTAPSLESLDSKIQVSEMRLVVGNDCPHAERLRKGTNMIFSLFYNGNEHLDFCAPTEALHNIWVDGLSVLLDKAMPSKAAVEDLDTLVNMDLKLRLLDMENITIPNQPPLKPADPPNFDFYYKLD